VLENLFDRVCIINLEHRSDRRRETEAALERLGCRVDGNRVRFHRAVKAEDAGSFPSIGARGCFLSHLAVLREASRDLLSSLLILEDDVKFESGAAAILRTLPAALAETGAGMVYGLPPEAEPERDTPSRFVIVPPVRSILRAHMVRFLGPAIEDAGGYLEVMLERPGGSPDGGPMHVEGAYGWFRRSKPTMQTLAAVPAIARQRSSRSDIATPPCTGMIGHLSSVPPPPWRGGSWRVSRDDA
jgi:hypothetical protein